MNRTRGAFLTYIAASSPGWGVAIVVAVLLHELGGVGGWTAIALAAVWIGTDLAMFPRVRRYYTPEASDRMVGKIGTAVSPITPNGFARVDGELWQVVAADPASSIPAGAGVRVCGIRGLELVVQRETGR